MRDVVVDLHKRANKLVGLDARGKLDGNKTFTAC